MRADVAVFDFIENLQEKKSVDTVGDSFQRLALRFGFTRFLAGRLTPNLARGDRGEVWASTGQNDWFEVCFKRHYRQDPGSDRARNQLTPFLWSDLRPVFKAKNISFLDDLSEFGILEGISTSFRFDRDIVFGVTLGTPECDIDPGTKTALLLASAYCGTKLAQLRHGQPCVATPLSDRERECLCWVACGKTDWDISEILGVSQQTVHKHVSNALRKLGASTRAHAVAVALSARILSP
jgi:LuxR family quorum sensing-dependent transcriptional regulator